MGMRNNFVALVLCHGRPDNTPTYDALRKHGYTGKILLVLDDEDETIPEYQKIFGEENIRIFSKDEISKEFDIMDTGTDRRCAVFARNACFKIAVAENAEYFCQFDDDYFRFRYRFQEDSALKCIDITNLDELFDTMLDFMKVNVNIKSVALAQGGDLIGGLNSKLTIDGFKRKCMNSIFCKTDRVLQFNGRMNDDTTVYAHYGSIGGIFLTTAKCIADQPPTQQVKGGMTDIYNSAGTYQKSFYTVMQCPSFVKISMMGDTHYRIHHFIEWNKAVPKIISDKYKKR